MNGNHAQIPRLFQLAIKLCFIVAFTDSDIPAAPSLHPHIYFTDARKKCYERPTFPIFQLGCPQEDICQ